MATDPPYSRLRWAGPLAVTAGILGLDGDGLVSGGTSAELAQALVNLRALLSSENIGLDRVVRLVVYLTDIEDIGLLNEAFVAAFDKPRPTRTTVAVSALPVGASVEIEATVATEV